MVTVATEGNRTKNDWLWVLLRAGEGRKAQFPAGKIRGLACADGSGRAGPNLHGLAGWECEGKKTGGDRRWEGGLYPLGGNGA